MTTIKIEDVPNLRGKALQDAAKTFDIKGRSGLSASELRAALRTEIERREYNEAMQYDGELSAIDNSPATDSIEEDEYDTLHRDVHGFGVDWREEESAALATTIEPTPVTNEELEEMGFDVVSPEPGITAITPSELPPAQIDPLDVFNIVPNRRDRRREARRKPARIRSAGESLVRSRMAREAGEKGRFYHNRINRREYNRNRLASYALLANDPSLSLTDRAIYAAQLAAETK